jgi:high-affinity iron transporter
MRKTAVVLMRVAAGAAVLIVLGVMVWQGIAHHGSPDPTTGEMSRAGMILSGGVVIFREGLEAILVLAAVTAGLARSGRRDYLRAVPAGAAAAFLATIATWFIVVALISRVNAPELSVQAATGLLAIVVLLIVMNWFFHKVYWTGWITSLSGRRKRLLQAAGSAGPRAFLGLALLGFAAVYREGFEVVLFLQDLRLKAGNGVILEGAAIGLALTLIVAALTFVGHRRLPYKKMLVLTGALLAVVLLVMVGEEAQEMQLAGWIATTRLPIPVPDWLGMWFAVFPTLETLVGQALAATLVVGSYLWAKYSRVWKAPNGPGSPEARMVAAD